jgi:hypothetical protein
MQWPEGIRTHNSSAPHDFVIAPSLTFDQLSAALLFVAIACAACFMPAQNDTWWHLRAGEEIWRTGHVPLLDTFSHTAYGTYWPDHEWLSQLLFFGLYQLGGLKLLTAFLATIVTATWLLVWRLTPGNHWFRILFVCLAVVPSSLAWSIRPQIFTLLFVPLTAHLLATQRHRWLPMLFLIWANLHGAVLFGVIILAATTAGTALVDRRRASRLLGVTLVCAVMTCATPLGISFWTEIPSSLARVDHNRVIEWHAPQFSDPVFATFWIIIAAFVMLLVLHRVWTDRGWFSDGAIAGSLALLPLGLGTGRHVPVLMVLIVPALASLASARFSVPTTSRIRREHPRLNTAVAAAAIALAAGVVTQAWGREPRRLGWHPLPSQAIAAIASCPGRLYNRYDEGGFLIWFTPTQKVFLDSRYDPFPPELLLGQIALEESGEYATTFRRYGIQCAFVPADSLLARRLASDGWRTTFRDAGWAVLTTPG